jgi:hypothetical protein
MNEKNTFTKASKIKTRKVTPDYGVSKNHSKSVKFRLRVQQDKEALTELKAYDEDIKRDY